MHARIAGRSGGLSRGLGCGSICAGWSRAWSGRTKVIDGRWRRSTALTIRLGCRSAARLAADCETIAPMSHADKLPSQVAMAWPTLIAIKRAGGSATNSEIMEAVASDLGLSEQQRAITRTPRSTRTLLDYRLAWTRTLLKNMGAIINDAPAHWSITDIGRHVTPDDIGLFVKGRFDKLADEMGRTR